MKRHSRDLDIISNINITNLLDTVLVLLVSFMLVAPTLKSGIQVDLPKVEGAASVEDDQQGHTITIASKDVESIRDRIYLDGNLIHLEDLRPEMEKAYATNPKVAITIESDGGALWESVAQVIAVCRDVGIENFAFSTEPAPPQQGQPQDKRRT